MCKEHYRLYEYHVHALYRFPNRKNELSIKVEIENQIDQHHISSNQYDNFLRFSIYLCIYIWHQNEP